MSGTRRGKSQCTLTKLGLPVRVALLLISLLLISLLLIALLLIGLLLIMASWLRGCIMALLTLGRRGPRVAATSGLVVQHSQHSTCDGSYPPLTGSSRCASIRARLLGAALVPIRHLLFGSSSVGANW